jgi:hypothetical protein
MLSTVRCLTLPDPRRVNTLLSICVCVFEAGATILTLLRSVQALRFGGGAFALRRNKKHTFNYLVVEQGVLYFAYVAIPRTPFPSR